MKLLLDQGLPRSTARLLREAGIDAVHVSEIGQSTAEDAVILERGRKDGRAVITLDADFHALLALSGAASPSVIRIRIEGLKGEPAAQPEDFETLSALCCQQNPLRILNLPSP